jgi:hypothetical protein
MKQAIISSRFLTVSARANIRLFTLLAFTIGIALRLNKQQNILVLTSSTSSVEIIDISNVEPASCFAPRGNNVHSLGHDYLHGPFINVGFPKMGSTSLHNVSTCWFFYFALLLH